MQYHEALWVVVGTAAPVLALAEILAYGQAVGAYQRGAIEGRDMVRVALKKIDFAFDPVWIAHWIAAAMFILDFALLLTAVAALGAEQDTLPLVWVLAAFGVNFVGLLLHTALMAIASVAAEMRGTRKVEIKATTPPVRPPAVAGTGHVPWYRRRSPGL